MAVAYKSVGSVTEGTDNTAETAAPSGVVSGDLLVLFLFIKTDNSNPSATPTTPSGWTARDSNNETSGSVDSSVWTYTRIADGTGSDTPTISLASTPGFVWQTVIVRLDSHDATTPYDTGNNGTGGGVDAEPIPTATVANDGSMALCGMAKNASGAYTLTWPGSWTSIVDTYTATGSGNHISVGYLAVNSGAMASESVSGWTTNPHQCVKATVVIAPAAGGGSANSYHYQRNQ